MRYASLPLAALLCLGAAWPARAQPAPAAPFQPLSASPSPAVPPPADSLAGFGRLVLPPGLPAYLAPMYHAALRAPLPGLIYGQGGIPATVPEREYDFDAAGLIGSFQPAGATRTARNAFFQPLGTNGRACITCHVPPNGMSVSVGNIRSRFVATRGTDPIFAPVDGATCPRNVPQPNTSGALAGGFVGEGSDLVQAYSLLLRKGLLRVFLPLPQDAEFTVEVLSDPYGCNTDPTYDQVIDPATGATTRIVSVYRRPRISANLAFAQPGPVMWDGREPTLQSQAIDATLGHAQAVAPPTAEQVAQMVQFETGLYTAQAYSWRAFDLSGAGAQGGPQGLLAAGTGAAAPATFTIFDAWSTLSGDADAMRASILRGQQIFDTRRFGIGNVAGLNDNPAFGNPFNGTCGSCHDRLNLGSNSFKAKVAIGVGGDSTGFGGPAPSTDLPIFRLTCRPGLSTPFNGASVVTNDPGIALITGRCADIGKMRGPSLRGVGSHPPFFSDGSAAGLSDVVEFYNARFAIGLSDAEKQDLVNFLNAL